MSQNFSPADKIVGVFGPKRANKKPRPSHPDALSESEMDKAQAFNRVVQSMKDSEDDKYWTCKELRNMF